jgi:hypothetical protein
MTDIPNKTLIREYTEWISICWHNAPDSSMKSVLLIGDSIVNGHGKIVHELLEDKIRVDSFATSKHVTDVEFMKDLDFMISRGNYELIVFNNGLHGFDIDDEFYKPALRECLTILKDRDLRLALRSSTPILDKKNLKELNEERNPRVICRNQDVKDLAGELDLPILDIYSETIERKDLFCPDAVHFSEEGNRFIAEKVVAFIQEHLPEIFNLSNPSCSL